MVPNTEPGAFPFNTNTARSTVWTGETSLSESAIFHVGQARDTRGTNHRDVALRYSAGRGEWGVVNVHGSDVRQFASFRALVRQP